MHHTEMTNDLWRAFKESQKIISLIKDDQTKRNAYSYIRRISFLFRQGLACKQSQESCKPVFKRFDNPLDMVFLEELFSENVVNDFEACNVIEPKSTRKRDCAGFKHDNTKSNINLLFEVTGS
ncbi:hypothetical protein CIHG_10577 [Coccidioides immitis H538.4]|uniref:Uncharacterized protein n=1 Tax=Coccidioides immitis H538.4 TaxID=396776 RepID=A0A0P6Q865_COCIT|nr:hypothetical protein CIHG_10577 [Coccidioides immitis H538.4]